MMLKMMEAVIMMLIAMTVSHLMLIMLIMIMLIIKSFQGVVKKKMHLAKFT